MWCVCFFLNVYATSTHRPFFLTLVCHIRLFKIQKEIGIFLCVQLPRVASLSIFPHPQHTNT